MDFRNPSVIEHVNEVIDRVVNEYGVGYIKMDYNIEPGIGTEIQAAVWSYPMRQGNKEEVIYNMINAMLLRIHQSGHLAELPAERIELVKEGIACYKTIRSDIKNLYHFCH